MSLKITSFKIDISPSEVERMKAKLKDTRLPQSPIVPDAGDDYGKHPRIAFQHGTGAEYLIQAPQ
jgi:phospholipase C